MNEMVCTLHSRATMVMGVSLLSPSCTCTEANRRRKLSTAAQKQGAVKQPD